MKLTIYPWQQADWQKLNQIRSQNHLPHAFLFSGIEGIGKKHFAEIFSQSLLCKNPTAEGFFCNNCQSCHLFNGKTHPDFLMIEPEEPGQMIKVDSIRALIEWSNETAYLSNHRIIILNPAHSMNQNAANSLLKTLEEPAPNIIFILITHKTSRIPATIRSRTQKITFEKPNTQDALIFLNSQVAEKEKAQLLLNIANGAPLKAISAFENKILELRDQLFQGLYDLKQSKKDPLKLASQLQESDLLSLFHLLQTWLKDLLGLQLTQDKFELTHVDYRQKYLTLLQSLSSIQLVRYIDLVNQLYEKISGPFNLNKLLVLEEVFISWSQYGSR